MAERLKSPESINIHERGGLTRKHWEMVIARIGQPKAFFNPPSAEIIGRISSYAHGVESGMLTDTNFNHRRFLGRRHWEEIGRLHIGFDAEFYSILEQTRNYTLNDYLDGVESSYPWKFVPKAPYDRPWEEMLVVTWFPSEGWYQVLPERFPVDEDLILSHWLLGKDDVPDPLRTPPDELKAKLIEKALLTPELILQRLNVQSRRIGGRFHFDPWGWVEENAMHFRPGMESKESESDQEICQYLQKAYKYHLGIKPFVVLSGPNQIVVIPTRDAAYDSARSRISQRMIINGEIDKKTELPTILPSLLEEDM